MENVAELIEKIKKSGDQRPHPCRHTMPGGTRCGSPAMRGEKFCYYHHSTRNPAADLRQRRARQSSFTMPAPNSRAAIQDALGQVIERIAGNDIDARRAGLLLYGLQLASCNLSEERHARRTSSAAPGAAPVASSSASVSYSAEAAFEEEVFTPPPAELRPLRRPSPPARLRRAPRSARKASRRYPTGR